MIINIDQEEIVQNYLNKNGITFELVAKDDAGNVIAKRTSSIAADDLVCDAATIDEIVEKQALMEHYAKLDEQYAMEVDEACNG